MFAVGEELKNVREKNKEYESTQEKLSSEKVRKLRNNHPHCRLLYCVLIHFMKHTEIKEYSDDSNRCSVVVIFIINSLLLFLTQLYEHTWSYGDFNQLINFF